MKKDNNEKYKITKEELELFEESNKLKCELDYYNITNGHDLLWLLAQVINKSYRGNWNEDRLNNIMLSAVVEDDLLSTAMFEQIRNWQDLRKMNFLQKRGLR